MSDIHHFRTLVENATDIIARYDRDFRHLYVNPAVERFTGHPPDHFIGRTSEEAGVLDPASGQVWKEALEAAFEEGREQRREFRIERAGTVLWTDTRFMPELDEAGEVRSVLEITRDITARKEVEAELEGTTDRLRAVLEASPIAVISFDLDGTVATWNPAAERIFGWSAEEVVGSSLPRVPEPSWERMREVAARVLEGQTVTDFEVEVRTRELRRVVVSVFAAPLHARPGSGITGILVILDDVTERKRAEEERRRLTSILEASPDFVGISDVEGNVLWVNEAGKRMVGMDPHEPVSGMSITSFHPPSTGLRIMKEFLPAVEKAGIWRNETLLRHRDGSDIPVSLVAVAHRDDRGRVAFRSMVARDLRPQRALEAQLRHSRRMEAVGRLAGGVAHQFNNVLTAIQGHADLALLTEDLPDELRDDLKQIQAGARRAARLTAQLTAYARRQGGDPRVLDLGALVREVAPALASVAGDAVTLGVEVAGEGEGEGACHRVEVDPVQIEQALMAMTLNAREAMPRGGELRLRIGRVRVKDRDAGDGRSALAPGAYVSLQVSDDGEGMDAATRERAFEPFFTTRDPAQSSGLGLSGVYGIVRQNGGHVSVESEPGKGATFTLLFPAVERERAAAEPAEAGAASRHA